MSALLIAVRFHDGRYHGRPEWPPSPARLFQALVSGAARGGKLNEEDARALGWLETLQPPVVAAPAMRRGHGFRNFVPNNDLDAVGGDPERIGKIRAPKLIRPILFDAETPLLFIWGFDDAPDARAHARQICFISERLYQLGRGVDMAWASGEVIDETEADARLAAHGGAVHRRSETGAGATLAAPGEGSLESLIARHQKMRVRFQTLYESKSSRKEPNRAGQLFAQPPKPRFREIAYDSPPRRLLFDLVGARTPWRLDRVVTLTELVRDAAARRLEEGLPGRADMIRNTIIGRRDGDKADLAARVRVTALPSIGHPHADHAIRRVLVEIPANSPLRADSVEWAFSGLEAIAVTIDPETGEVRDELTLASAVERGMLAHYGIEAAPARVWRTVTPIALPAARRRIDPEKLRREKAARANAPEKEWVAKKGEERAAEERNAASAAQEALRHAGPDARVNAMRLQREPFEAKGPRAEAFAPETRFAKERLWHVEIEFAEPQRGPLVLGDGRYLGLGLLAPAHRADGVLAFAIVDGLAEDASAQTLTYALRRAVLARVQEELGAGKPLPLYFTGHESNGAPSRGGHHAHVAFAYDEIARRLLVIAPHVLERRSPRRDEEQNWRLLAAAMRRFDELRAGPAGKLRLAHLLFDETSDPLFALSRQWRSATAYRVTRHRDRADPAAALVADIKDECRRLGLPRLDIEVVQTKGVPAVGLTGRARLHFAVAVSGPILIGRDRHFGGGLFVGS